MPFSNVWNNAVPADTQLADLLGDNIRDLKVDAQERMAQFASGLIASRPTPEAGFGAANYGVNYLAEDEGKIYRWNNSSWVLKHCIYVPKDTTFATISTLGSEQTLNSFTIPANFFVAGFALEVIAFFDGTLAAAGTAVVKLYLGGNSISMADCIAPGIIRATAFFNADGAATNLMITWTGGAGSAVSPVITTVVGGHDLTTSMLIKSTVNISAGSFKAKGLYACLRYNA